MGVKRWGEWEVSTAAPYSSSVLGGWPAEQDALQQAPQDLHSSTLRHNKSFVALGACL